MAENEPHKSTDHESLVTRVSSVSKSQPKRISIMLNVPAAKPVLRYMPTYRLEPKLPLNRETCEKIIKTVMDKTFLDFVYSPKISLNLCAQVSEEIKNRIKSLNFDRYRYVCIVTIGEKVMQGYSSVVNFLWDADHDGYLKYVHETPEFFVVASFYYLYFD